MTRDEIIRMAREVDLHLFGDAQEAGIERFFRAAYAAGAADEREACAKVCMEIEQSKPLSDRVGWEHGTVDCQVAIRARGQL